MKINITWTFKNIEHLYGDNCENLLFAYLRLKKNEDPCFIYNWEPGVRFRLDVTNIPNDKSPDYFDIEFKFYFSFTKKKKIVKALKVINKKLNLFMNTYQNYPN